MAPSKSPHLGLTARDRWHVLIAPILLSSYVILSVVIVCTSTPVASPSTHHVLHQHHLDHRSSSSQPSSSSSSSSSSTYHHHPPPSSSDYVHHHALLSSSPNHHNAHHQARSISNVGVFGSNGGVGHHHTASVIPQSNIQSPHGMFVDEYFLLFQKKSLVHRPHCKSNSSHVFIVCQEFC